MTRPPSRLRRSEHPLAGVLDRLLARERGDPHVPPRDPLPPGNAPPAAIAGHPSTTASTPAAAAPRRMLVIAAMGADEGEPALRAVARWGVREGRRPAVLDVGCGARTGIGATPPDAPRGGEAGDAGEIVIPWARVPCGSERLRPEPREAIPGFLARLRRHEAAADLLIVRIPPRPRMVLMRAALLAGGVVLPLDGSDEVRDEACRLSREVIENYVDLSLWPVTDDRRALERYLTALRDFPGARPCPLETSSGPSVLDGLPGAPEEGFLPALLRLDEASPPTSPLHEDLLRL